MLELLLEVGDFRLELGLVGGGNGLPRLLQLLLEFGNPSLEFVFELRDLGLEFGFAR